MKTTYHKAVETSKNYIFELFVYNGKKELSLYIKVIDTKIIHIIKNHNKDYEENE